MKLDRRLENLLSTRAFLLHSIRVICGRDFEGLAVKAQCSYYHLLQARARLLCALALLARASFLNPNASSRRLLASTARLRV